MPQTLASSAVSRHRLLPENAAGSMAKADLRKADVEQLREVWRESVGVAIARARALSGLSLKEFAAAVGREDRQVARWETGAERPQFDAILAVETLRQPLVQALGELAGAEVEITVRLRTARKESSR